MRLNDLENKHFFRVIIKLSLSQTAVDSRIF